VDKNKVKDLGNGDYSVLFPEPQKVSKELFLQISSNNLKAIAPLNKEMLLGLSGNKEKILHCLKLAIKDEMVLNEYIAALK
jgi:hypothetical protein